MEFAKRLSYNPWHCIAEHRPLGNQSRARRRMYCELSKLRHEMNKVPHYEPTARRRFRNRRARLNTAPGSDASTGSLLGRRTILRVEFLRIEPGEFNRIVKPD